MAEAQGMLSCLTPFQLGMLMLLGVVTLWVGSSELSQVECHILLPHTALMINQDIYERQNFADPFFLTYCNGKSYFFQFDL